MSDTENNRQIDPVEPLDPIEPVDPVEPLGSANPLGPIETPSPAKIDPVEIDPAEPSAAVSISDHDVAGPELARPDGQTAAPVRDTEAIPADRAASAPNTPPTPPPVTAYRWTYAEQAVHDTTAAAVSRRRGALAYTIAVTVAFLVSFALLITVLLLDNGTGRVPSRVPLGSGVQDNSHDVSVEGVQKAKPSVVVIQVSTNTSGSTGTGIIMTEDGYIATNHHVIEHAIHEEATIRVTFYDGSTAEATVIGSSEMDDLAVIHVKRTGLTPAAFTDSKNCYVGQTVYAIGTPAGAEFAFTTTRGIISYVDREVRLYDDEDGTLLKKLRLLQTDVNVNPGNSGGPLINTAGEVIGVVSMKLAEGYTGIGFAIPSDGAVEILNAIVNGEEFDSTLSHKRPMLGIVGAYMEANHHYLLLPDIIQEISEDKLPTYQGQNVVTPSVSGIYITEITEGMDAAEKLSPGDIITAVQGEAITSMDALMDTINNYYAGDTVTLTIYRGAVYTPVDIVLSAKPD